MNLKNNEIIIYTDGSSINNPGFGGWGAILISKKNVIEIGGRKENVTNNQMELMAVLKSFEFLLEKNVSLNEIFLKSDSKYFLNGIEEWIYNWQKNGWKTANKKSVLNKDLWQEIFNLKKMMENDNKFFFEHVPAHTGEKFNERADSIARSLAENKKVNLFSGKTEDYKILNN